MIDYIKYIKNEIKANVTFYHRNIDGLFINYYVDKTKDGLYINAKCDNELVTYFKENGKKEFIEIERKNLSIPKKDGSISEDDSPVVIPKDIENMTVEQLNVEINKIPVRKR